MRRWRGHSKRCFDVFAALVGALSLGLVPVQASAAEKDLTNKGEVLVKENCSRCHAIGKEGNSPHPEAPPFRTLSSRYPIEDLSESLAEGIVSGHPDMPIFVFGPADVEAMLSLCAGLRVGEIAALKIGDVATSEGETRLRAPKAGLWFCPAEFDQN
jgi:cytochrome c